MILPYENLEEQSKNLKCRAYLRSFVYIYEPNYSQKIALFT